MADNKAHLTGSFRESTVDCLLTDGISAGHGAMESVRKIAGFRRISLSRSGSATFQEGGGVTPQAYNESRIGYV
jgi:hypothetical protein